MTTSPPLSIGAIRAKTIESLNLRVAVRVDVEAGDHPAVDLATRE